MNEPELSDEILELMGELVNETNTPEQFQQLEELLTNNARAREIYLDYLDNEFDLQAWHEEAAVPEALMILQRHMEDADVLQQKHASHARRFLGYTVVAGIAICASLLLQVALFDGKRDIAAPSGPSELPALTTEYVATVARTPDCVWDGELRPGDGWRLSPGKLNLKEGVAELRFDSGVALVIEGPTMIEIESANAATLVEGKVVVRADEASEEFVLRTPGSSFVDLGTEYAVAVDASGEAEVHVFDGIVARKGSVEGTEEQLTAGEAKRFAPGDDSAGISVPLAKDQFVHRVPKPKQARDPALDLLVRESFDYDVGELPAGRRAAGGIGFAGPWVKWAASPRAQLELVPGAELDTQPPQKRIHQNLAAHIGRPLEQPLRLDVDGLYYISFLFRQPAPPGKRSGYTLHLTFRREDPDPIEKKLRVGVGHGRGIFGLLAGNAAKASLPLDDHTEYRMVVKLVTGRDRPDQLFATVIRSDDRDIEKEPDAWTLVGDPIHTDLTLPSVWVHFNVSPKVGAESHQWLDELRVGKTWASVTTPLPPTEHPTASMD